MSRNLDRTGATPGGSDVPPAHPVSADDAENDSFSFSYVVPTELIDIPSGGRFYSDGHPVSGKSYIEIRHMTAKEEDILTSRTLLQKGLAIDRLLKNIMVDKSIDPSSLLTGDRNALIIAARKTGYGPEYTTNVTCPACATTARYEFDLNEFLVNEGGNSDLAEVQETTDKTFLVELPTSGVNVELRLMTGRDELNSQKKSKGKIKAGLGDIKLTEQIKNFIVSVNGSTSTKDIGTFVNNMPAKDSRFLRNVYAEITPNIDTTQEYECGTCGYEQDMEVPLTADFFWPRQ